MEPPAGHRSVEHDDGKVHAIALSDLTPEVQRARTTPVCGAATGPSSDTAGAISWAAQLEITCWECIALLS